MGSKEAELAQVAGAGYRGGYDLGLGPALLPAGCVAFSKFFTF